MVNDNKRTKQAIPLSRKRFNEYGLPVLLIDTGSSTCGYCGLGADPHAKKHMKVLSVSEAQRALKGCGTKWTMVSSNCSGEGVVKWCERMRPDLKFLSSFELLTMVSDMELNDFDKGFNACRKQVLQAIKEWQNHGE